MPTSSTGRKIAYYAAGVAVVYLVNGLFASHLGVFAPLVNASAAIGVYKGLESLGAIS